MTRPPSLILHLTLLIVGVFWRPAAGCGAETPSGRDTSNLNREWKFTLGDVKDGAVPSFDDRAWSCVGLPHSFSLPYFGSSQFYTGYGWYRKRLVIPDSCQGKRLFLEFDGVFQVAEVFINGKRVGEHRGGYTGFSLDVTGAARPGEENVLAVRVNNLWDARLAPRAGEHVFSGGIYRDVRLVATAPLHVVWYGTFVTTPQVSEDAATVNVKTEIVNAADSPKNATVKTEILDADGKVVTAIESARTVAVGTTLTFDQTSQSISNPKLWHPDHPYLYSVRTTLLDDDRPVDSYVSPLGIRWFKWTADQGFFLNGKHFYIYGANVHQDHAGWGDGVTDAALERDVHMVKEAGFSFIRGSHYPRHPAFVDACDRLGVLLWSENAFWGIGGFKSDGYWNASAYPSNVDDQSGFEASVRQQLQEMIRIHRNHPAIVVWSMGNEVFFSEKSLLPKVKDFLGRLVAYAHELDPTRPAGIGGAQRPLDDNRIDKVGDVAGYNGDGASIGVFQEPGVPNIVSEYCCTTAKRPGDYKPGWDQLAKDGGQPVRPWRSGQVIWCMFDHGSIAGTNLGHTGIVDYFRIPKRAWYWYRNTYEHVPPPAWTMPGTPAKLRLEADKTLLRSVDGTDDVHLQVTVLDADDRELSNAVPVTLSLVSGPGEFPTGPSITFEPNSDVAMLDGKAAVEFRSYYAGTTVLRGTSPGLVPAEITISSQGEPRWIEGTTPMVGERPYKAFTRTSGTDKAGHDASACTLAADRPTEASSTAADSSPANVNDGKPSTVWSAAGDDRSPWIQVDLEITYSLTDVRLTFPDRGAYRYSLTVSANGHDWTTVVDEPHGQNTELVRTASGRLGSGVRFLRVNFVGWPPGKTAALAEIQVAGTSTVQ